MLTHAPATTTTTVALRGEIDPRVNYINSIADLVASGNTQDLSNVQLFDPFSAPAAADGTVSVPKAPTLPSALPTEHHSTSASASASVAITRRTRAERNRDVLMRIGASSVLRLAFALVRSFVALRLLLLLFVL